jgi:glycosyltransferase involved in cell wall biosynthesis
MRRRPLVYGEPYLRTAHANPYTRALYESVAEQGFEVRELSYPGMAFRAPDIVHLHWPELTFLAGTRRWRVVARLVLFYTCFGIGRLRGTRMVWTCHNVAPHEERSTPLLRRISRRMLTRSVDGVICLTESGVHALREAYPELRDRPTRVVPHGHYRGFYDLGGDKTGARDSLGIGNRIFLATVGQIRPYKNVPALIDAVAALDRPDLLLGVAGNPAGPELAREIRERAARLPDVRLELGFLPDETLSTWLLAADAIVLPYRAIQNSGSALLALSAGRPVIVPDLGAMAELRDAVGPEWVYVYQGELTSDRLSDALAWLAGTRRSPEGPDLTSFDWHRIGALTADLYRAVLARPRRRRP